MKTDELRISQSPQQIADALDKIELIALYSGMPRREATSMRLLAEEMLAATRNILDAFEGRLWMDTDNEAFSVHLCIAKPSSKEDREKLIKLSKDGEVKPPKGMFARLGSAIEKFLLMDENGEESQVFADYAMFAGDMNGLGMTYSYHYLPMFDPAIKKQPAKQLDELAGIEKSIIDAIVDDIYVTVPGGNVEIVAVKNLKKEKE